jgi:hypothetical protein
MAAARGVTWKLEEEDLRAMEPKAADARDSGLSFDPGARWVSTGQVR